MNAEDQLYEAVQRYIEDNGGRLVVVGGIEIHHDPLGPEFNFKLAVRCTGTRPVSSPDKATVYAVREAGMSECGFRIERGSYFIGPCRLEAGHAGVHHPQTEAESQAERDYVNRLLREETGYDFDPIAGATPSKSPDMRSGQ